MKRLIRLAVSVAAMAAVVPVILAVSTTPASAAPSCLGAFSSTGTEQACTVPGSGTVVLQVTAVGGRGGNPGENDGSTGGAGAVVSTDVTVTGGSTLYLDVASDGATTTTSPTGGTGGMSGPSSSGGTGGCYDPCPSGRTAGGGGGASVVQTCSISLAGCIANYYTVNDPRLVVAGGGGGAGGFEGCGGGSGGGGVGASLVCAPGGGGGGAGTGGSGNGDGCAGGGAGATPGSAGAGGISDGSSENGSSGAGPVGGNGFVTSASAGGGGGGGGGYYGGGGGSAENDCTQLGAGGGAGSSIPTSATITNEAPGQGPSITITLAEAFSGSTKSISATEGASTGTITVATVSDVDGSGVSESACADWNTPAPIVNWGDGTSSPGTAVCGTAQPIAIQGSHTYAEEGSFPITVDVTDADEPTSAQASGNIATAEVSGGSATVADANLTGVATPTQQFKVGKTASKTLVDFTDADPAGVISDYSASINWGDGHVSAGTISSDGLGGWFVTGAHKYTASGAFTIHITISDSGGSSTIVVDQARVK